MAQVHVRSWQVGYRGLIADDVLDALRPEDRMRRYTFGSTDPAVPHTSVAIDRGVIVGFITTAPCRDADLAGLGEVVALYVDPDAWGRGVGRILMQHGRAQLRDDGFTQGALWVLTGNEQAQRFYRQDGWMPDGSRRDAAVWDVPVVVARYRRRSL